MSNSNRRYFCTCQVKHLNGKNSEARHLKFHRTEVDENEICVHCGYYAWEEPRHTMLPRQGNLQWISQVCSRHNDPAWSGITEKRDAYYEKTMFSDWELDGTDAFDPTMLHNGTFEDDLNDTRLHHKGEHTYAELKSKFR